MPERRSPRPRMGGSPLQRFEWQCRADKRLNAKTRLAWLLTALSRKGPAKMAVSRMAKELNASPWVVQVGLQKLVREELFERVGRGRYQRTAGPGKFAVRVRACGRLDLTVRVLWLLIDLSSKSADGSVVISHEAIAKQLSANRQRVYEAVRRIVDFGLVGNSGRPGKTNTYHIAIMPEGQGDAGAQVIEPDGTPVAEEVSYRDHFASRFSNSNRSDSSDRRSRSWTHSKS